MHSLVRLPGHGVDVFGQRAIECLAELLLRLAREGPVRVVEPGRSDRAEIAVDEPGEGAVWQDFVRVAVHDVAHRRSGHQRGAARNVDDALVRLLDRPVTVGADVVPGGCLCGHHVRLVAARGHDVVDAGVFRNVLAQVVHADVHQFDRVERAAAGLRGSRSVGRDAVEREPRAEYCLAVPVIRPGPVGRVPGENDIDVVEQPGAQHVGLGVHGFLGRRAVEPHRAREIVRRHDAGEGDRRGGGSGSINAVAAAVAGDDRRIVAWLAARDGFLRDADQCVVLGEVRDHGLAPAEACNERRRHPGDIRVHGEAVFPEPVHQLLRRARLLEARLGVTPDGLVDLCSPRPQPVHFREHRRLSRLLCGCRRKACRRGDGERHQRAESRDPRHSAHPWRVDAGMVAFARQPVIRAGRPGAGTAHRPDRTDRRIRVECPVAAF
jgi:hypothetical protein